ncbi:hypothetical protein GCM10022295_02940 [Streptomyces osmaniensis]|uniref:ABM domain-containing protein n=1 Tax=Streptomyces osmaniensis TaxID=593134 RepID=A0ABP6V0S3_9ACTN
MRAGPGPHKCPTPGNLRHAGGDRYRPVESALGSDPALGEVWNHVESTYPDFYGFRNYGWDQVMANRGSVNYCVRWESDAPVSAALRDQIHTALKKQFGKWTAAMVESDGTGHNAWLTKGFQGGAGGDWGQRVGQEYFTSALGQGEHPPLSARGRPHLRPRRFLRLEPDRPVLLPDEGRLRHADHRVRQVDAPRLLAPPEAPLRALTAPGATPPA